MRSAIATLLLGLASPAFSQAFQMHGVLTTREIRVQADDAGWIDGGVGPFDVGGHRTLNQLQAQLGFDWTPARWLLVHADGLARNGRLAGAGDKAGVVQAYVDLFNEHWRLRAGHFWLPTSRENIDPLWNSRYTITYSALNTWVGEEVRPIGADLQFAPNFYVTLGVTAFRDNDTMGTVLAERGWTLGNRLTVFNEVIPLPVDSTHPFGRDLDGKNGYAERIRAQIPERASIQFVHVDNNATIGRGEAPNEPWRTRYDTVGATLGTTTPTTLSAEWAKGSTTVGFTGGTFRVAFNAAYLLLSHKRGADRLTARIERYETRAEDAHAVTGAWLHDIGTNARVGLEYVRASGNRAGSTVSLELRYSF